MKKVWDKIQIILYGCCFAAWGYIGASFIDVLLNNMSSQVYQPWNLFNIF